MKDGRYAGVTVVDHNLHPRTRVRGDKLLDMKKVRQCHFRSYLPIQEENYGNDSYDK